MVRRFSNTDKPEVTEEDLQKQLIPLYWMRPFRTLATDPGMHRWLWRLHYPPPQATRHEYPIAAIPHDTPRVPLGPTVLPGDYTVRLTVDGKSSTAPLNIKMDPRIKVSTASLQKKFQSEMQLASALTSTTRAILEGNAVRTQLQNQHADTNPQVKDAVAQFQAKLDALLAGNGPPTAGSPSTLARANEAVATLYGQIWQVDAEPTSAQLQALSMVDRDGADVLKRWEELKNTELPALNRILRHSSAPEININADLGRAETDMEDEE